MITAKADGRRPAPTARRRCDARVDVVAVGRGDHVLVDGRIDTEEAGWLQQLVFADGAIRDEERKFLHELKGEAGDTSPEFEALFKEAMQMPQERRTSS